MAEAVSSCIKATLLSTNVFHLFGGPCIHVKAMEESVHRWDSFTVTLRARMAFLYNLASNVAAHNSNLGIVSCFSDATFDVEHSSRCFVIAVCRTDLQTGSINLFTAVTKSMNLDISRIKANNLPVDSES